MFLNLKGKILYYRSKVIISGLRQPTVNGETNLQWSSKGCAEVDMSYRRVSGMSLEVVEGSYGNPF